jgi:uncharacterized protein
VLAGPHPRSLRLDSRGSTFDKLTSTLSFAEGSLAAAAGAHPTAPGRGENLVRTQSRTGRNRHGLDRIVPPTPAGDLGGEARRRTLVGDLLPALASLIALQRLDSAADAARKRLAELPAVEQAIEADLAARTAEMDAIKAKLHDNQQARRALEKDVATVDSRLARFEDHKAAVKTNQEYHALLHEIATAKIEKDAEEEKILILMEAADGLTAELAAASKAFIAARQEGEKTRAELAREQATLTVELDRLARERADATRGADAGGLARYDQLIRQRRGLAVVAMKGEICSACHVRLRPHITQMIRRNDGIVQCESCQRILYFPGPESAA